MFNLELDNTQSVARDHLANERTFLAWLRTGLTFASVGVALTQLFRLRDFPSTSFTRTMSAVVGSLFVGAGIGMLTLGTTRYFSVERKLQKGVFPVTRVAIWLSFWTTIALVVLTLGVLIKVAIY